MNFLKKFFLSRRFVLSVVFGVLVIVNKKFNLGLDTEAMITLAVVFGSFILGESYKDAKHAGAGHLVVLANDLEDKDIPEALMTIAKDTFFQDANGTKKDAGKDGNKSDHESK